MRWYIGRGYLGYYSIDHIIGVIIAPDDVGKEELEDLLRRGGEDLFLRPYWDRDKKFDFKLLTWDELQLPYHHHLHRDVVEASETGHIWTGVFRETFKVIYWDEMVRKVMVEPEAFKELDALAHRRGSFRNARRISELLALLKEESEQ